MLFSKPLDYIRRKFGQNALPSEDSSTNTRHGSHHKSASLPVMSGQSGHYGPYTTPQWNPSSYAQPWQAQQYPYPATYPYSFPGPPSAPTSHHRPFQTPSTPYSQPPPTYYRVHPAAPTSVRQHRSRSRSRHEQEAAASSVIPSANSRDTSLPSNKSSERLGRSGSRRHEEPVMVKPSTRRDPTPAPSRFRRPPTPRPEPPTPEDDIPERKIPYKSFSLLNELSSTPEFPAINWNVTHRLHHAVMTVQPGKTVPLDMKKKAICPDPPFVFVTTLNLSSALQNVLNRWGPMMIRCGKTKTGESSGVTLGDVLQCLYNYFNTRLTSEEIKDLSPEEYLGMRSSGSKRWRAAHDVDHLGWSRKDEDVLLEDVSKGYSRADLLEDHLYFGGMHILSTFYETKTLYLILEMSPPGVQK